MNVRIMLPTTPKLFFPFHAGLLYGHGIASRSLWLPFVDVTADGDRSRSMQILEIKKSRELIKYAKSKSRVLQILALSGAHGCRSDCRFRRRPNRTSTSGRVHSPNGQS